MPTFCLCREMLQQEEESVNTLAGTPRRLDHGLSPSLKAVECCSLPDEYHSEVSDICFSHRHRISKF